MKQLSAKDVEAMESKFKSEIKLTAVQVNEDTYASEPKGEDNKGFHLRRDKRMVGRGLRLGHKIHDRTSNVCERQRMLVEFDSELDKFMGSTWNKTVADTSLPQPVIGDAIFRIWRQFMTDWDKQCQDDVTQNLSSTDYDSEESQTVEIPVASQAPVKSVKAAAVQEPEDNNTQVDESDHGSDGESVVESAPVVTSEPAAPTTIPAPEETDDSVEQPPAVEPVSEVVDPWAVDPWLLENKEKIKSHKEVLRRLLELE
jgi:hypothetical protein